ncbi:MAG: type I restriction-modification system subunit M [Chloroflexi bacterium HGW-Chloroflexi-3]|nr:MAG: type I restriction-modification system subunit M [Chloroflexi bacterium HGW-Chloroflexi-3]
MAIKKSELYSSLWKSCDELRGGMDASQYKDYVLVLLFMKYVSDKYAGKNHALIEVPPGGSFQDMVALKGKVDIGDGINKIIAKLAEANDLKGVIDVADFNNEDKLGRGKEMVDRLSNLISIFQNPALDFSKNRAEGDDLLGDAYEYLMKNFATQSGKSKGQFYTPAEVSRVIAQVIGVQKATRQNQTIYDPTCGSGSLLLKAAAESETVITIYGQEMDNATAAMARMNMILHENPTAEIWKDNTLSNPYFKNPDGALKTFDFVVANPPFSTKSWSNGFDPDHDLYDRFVDGIPPSKNGDYAFLLHIIRSMKSTGKGAVILPHGVLFRGNAEGEIRRNIINKGYIKGIISLPANLFFGTGIPACIIVLDKENAGTRKGIFMIDASKGFIKDGNKNRLRHQDIRKIVDVFNGQLEIPGYSRMVPTAEIRENEFNLNIPRYIDSSELEDIQDIEAHLKGGIPNRDIEALEKYWKDFPSLKEQLFMTADRDGYSQLKVEKDQIKNVIQNNKDFQEFSKKVKLAFETWSQRILTPINSLNPPLISIKNFIEVLSDLLFQEFSDIPLIDKYDVYQKLMDYWTETMQDDVFMIVNEGWVPNEILIPAEIIINQFFLEEQFRIFEFETEKGNLVAQKEELEEEHSGEEGVFEELRADNGKISKSDLKHRIQEIKDDYDFVDEFMILNEYLKILDNEVAINKIITQNQKQLQVNVKNRYSKLSNLDSKNLIIEMKWMPKLKIKIDDELENLSQCLYKYLLEIERKYNTSLISLEEKIEILSDKAYSQLEKMGYLWK